jgi:DMSO/TMAO reductase YedYZ molybdopterin-dependent catalytic subunit
MALPFLRRPLNGREQAVANQLPHGQYLTEKWPVLHYGGVPRVDLATWDLRVDGLVEQPLRLTYDELRRRRRIELKADIHCVTRWSLLDSTWGGIALPEVLTEARIKPSATHVLVHAERGYTTNLPFAELLRPDNMLADTRNGEPISPEHGWPFRLLVPHLYFWKSAKWVRRFELLDRDRAGFWEGFGYHNHGDPWLEERYG